LDAQDIIFSRHSVARVRTDPVPRELVERLLSAGAQAPNHYKARPWRFIVLTGEARVRLGEVMAQARLKRHADCTAGDLNAERARPLRAPVIIAVGVDKPSEPKVVEIENICAAAAAAQNILLAASALGLGAMWRTGQNAREPEVKQFLGLEPDQHLIAFIYVGYPEPMPVPEERPSYEDRTVWMVD
jgi:nitroreductase